MERIWGSERIIRGHLLRSTHHASRYLEGDTRMKVKVGMIGEDCSYIR